MKTELDTIRVAIEKIRDRIPKALYALEDPSRNPYDAYPELKDAEIALRAINLAALSAIDPDAKPQEPSEDALDFLDDLLDTTHRMGFTDAAALITAHDDAIRRECAENADACLDRQGLEKGRYSLRAFVRSAILGTEPTIKSSHALESEMEECRPEAGTEPAREEE